MLSNGENGCMLKRLVILLIRGYRYALSPYFGYCCRFTPTCSEYAILVIDKYGVIKGFLLTAKRLLRCHPWYSGGEDAAL